jgi:hypothetical protein
MGNKVARCSTSFQHGVSTIPPGGGYWSDGLWGLLKRDKRVPTLSSGECSTSETPSGAFLLVDWEQVRGRSMFPMW